jgi:bla regulator protein BlaR1
MENEKKPRPSKRLTKSQRRRRRKIRRNIWRVTLSVLTVVILVLVGALCAGYAAFRGPSQTVGDLLTVSMQETSALKFVPHIYYSNEEVDAILERNSVSAGDSETDTSLIVI